MGMSKAEITGWILLYLYATVGWLSSVSTDPTAGGAGALFQLLGAYVIAIPIGLLLRAGIRKVRRGTGDADEAAT